MLPGRRREICVKVDLQKNSTYSKDRMPTVVYCSAGSNK